MLDAEIITPSQRAAHLAHVQRRERMFKAALSIRPAPVPSPIPVKRDPVDSRPRLEDMIVNYRFEADIQVLRYAEDRPCPPISFIVEWVCRHFKVSRLDLVSDRRTAPLVFIRHKAFWLARSMTVKSLPEIGRRIGGRDHTTVLNGLRRIDAKREHDPALRTEMENSKASIEAAWRATAQ